MSKTETQMSYLLRRQAQRVVIQDSSETQETKKPANQEPQKPTKRESKNSRNQHNQDSRETQEPKKTARQEPQKPTKKESKNSRNQQGQDSRKTQERKRSREVIDDAGRIRRPANITIQDDVKEALDILAVKRRVRPWKLLDQALREFLEKEGVKI